MLKRKLTKFKRVLEDLRLRYFRDQVPRHEGLEEHGLRDYQVYPDGGNLSLEFFTQPKEQYSKLIDKFTPITSIGSCFAVEIKHHLKDAKFNFIGSRESWPDSSEWGRVYTTKNLLQIFQYSFTEFLPEIRMGHNRKGYFDPYHEGLFYPSEDAAEKGLLEHYEESRRALTSCEVLIVTPGQNEAWITQEDGLAWAHQPPSETFETYGKDRFSVKRFTLAENIEYLGESLRLLWANNPEAQVIFTVSPVPSHSTFYDTNVAVQSFENKAILLLAVKEIISQYPDRTHYYPSFEMSLLSNNWNFTLDNRHVRPKVVDGIMFCFDRRFVDGD